MDIEERVQDASFSFDFKVSVQNERCKCIYGIFIGDRLVYIGYTYHGGFKERVDRHEEAIKDSAMGDRISKELYQALRENVGNYSFKILYRCPIWLDESGLQVIEKMLITTLTPQFNKEGVSVPYRFRQCGQIIS